MKGRLWLRRLGGTAMIHDEPPDGTTRETVLPLVLTAMFGGAFLVFLILVSGGFFFYVVSAVLVIAVFGWLHWVLWGQSLTREVARERQEEERKERRQADVFLSDKIRPRRF